MALANEGVHVTLTARGAEALKKTADEIRKAYPPITVKEAAGATRKTGHSNVTINALLPGPLDTDRLRGVGKAEAEKRGITADRVFAERAKQNPAGRFGEPDEFGYACAFLCGAKAGYITGQN